MISLPYAEESNMLSHLDTILKVVDEQTDRITKGKGKGKGSV